MNGERTKAVVAMLLFGLLAGSCRRDHRGAVDAYLADLVAGRCEAAQARLAAMSDARRTDWIAHCGEVTGGPLGRAVLARTTWKITGTTVDREGGSRVDVSWTSPDVQSEFTAAFEESVDALAKDVNEVLSGKSTSSTDPFEKNFDAMVARIDSGEVPQATLLFVFDVNADGRITSAPIPAPGR